MTTNDTPETAGLAAAEIHPAATLLMDSTDMLDRVVELGRKAQAVETIEVALLSPIHGLPDSVTALVKHMASGPVVEPLRPLFKDFETAPQRRKGCATVTTLMSFVDLVNRHKDQDTAIFARTAWPAPKLTAVVNYHRKTTGTDAGTAPIADDRARYGDHRIEYAFPLTDEFKAWMAMNGKGMEQAEFAAFLEDHVAELASPYDPERQQYQELFKEKMAIPTEVVALARDLEIYVGQKIKRKERLQTGERSIVFENAHTNAAGEPVDIPGVFMIAVPAFVDGEPIRIPARLRYRPKGSDVIWFYDLYRPEFWLRAQVQNDLLEASTRTGLPAYEGEPEGGSEHKA